MAAIPVSMILKIAASATLALMTFAAFSVASGDGAARAQPFGSKTPREICVFLIF